MSTIRKAVATFALAALLAPAGAAFGQDNSDNNDRGRERGERGERGGDRERGPGGPGGFDPARIREFMLNRVKEQLAPSDEEWQVLQPKIEKVMDARQEQMGGFGFGGGGMGGFGGGRGGRDGGQEREPRNASERAVRELRTAIDSNASAEQIAAKLTALREARTKAQANLKAAQEDLKGVVTAKQEAQLVLSGMLE